MASGSCGLRPEAAWACRLPGLAHACPAFLPPLNACMAAGSARCCCAASSAGTCPVHGHGCKTLLNHADQAAAVVGVYMADAGIMFHSGT